MGRKPRGALLATSLLLLALAGCQCAGGDDAGACTTSAQCPGGACVDGQCVQADADADADGDAEMDGDADLEGGAEGDAEDGGEVPTSPVNPIHVSPTGADSDPGTLERPLRTLAAAQQAVRRLRTEYPPDTFARIDVILRGGTYELAEPLVFEPEDGGSATCTVTWGSYPGETAVLSGGTPLADWSATSTPSIVRAPAGGRRFRQLYVASGWLGDRPLRARFPYPDRQYFKLLAVNRGPDGCSVASFRLETPYPLEAPQVDRLVGSEMVLLKTFAQSRVFVERAATTGLNEATIYPTPATGTAEGCATNTLIDGAFRVYFEGYRDWIVDAGRWSLDGDGYVYYLPHAYDDLDGGVVAPRLENLIAVAGREGDPVVNLAFDGLELRHTGWLAPSDNGEIGKQAGFESFAWIGAVRLDHAQGITVSRSRLAQLGASGIVVGPDTDRISLTQNNFSEIAGNGISVRTLDVTDRTDTRQLCRNLVVEDNIFQGLGLDYAGVGIFAGYLPEAAIRHNLFRFIGYSAISLGWFPLVSVPGIGLYGGADRVPTNSVVSYNDISQVTRYYHDGGGIYAIGGNPGLAINDNYVHDVVYTPDEGGFVGFLHAGIYLDGYASDNVVFDNYEHNLTDGLFLQTYNDGTVNARAKFNTVTALSLTSVDTPIYLAAQVLAEAARPEVNNVIEYDARERVDIAAAAGLSAEARTLWAHDLSLAYEGFFRVGEGIYRSRGPEYCAFPTWDAYVAASGGLDVRKVPVYPELPAGQAYAGGCP